MHILLAVQVLNFDYGYDVTYSTFLDFVAFGGGIIANLRSIGN